MPSSTTPAQGFQCLFESIQKRPRPEDVAELILEVHPDTRAKKVLMEASRHSFKKMAFMCSSMARDFSQVKGADKIVAQAAQNFGLEKLTASACLDPTLVRAFTEAIGAHISMAFEQRDFLKDRLNREQRKKAGIPIRKRGYNRRVRTMRRLATRIDSMLRNNEKYLATRVAKSSGATFLTLEDLSTDLDTACFVAYMSARMNLRSAFTNSSQTRPYDDVAETLLDAAMRNGNPNWYAISLVHPEVEVLKNLTSEQKLKLLGVWTECLARLAALLETLSMENDLNLKTMVVARGNDSSSWNAAAGAWNMARTQWISLTYALGMESLLETYCPGKVMRLMAADVVRWHSMTKGANALEPNTAVFADLPMPWLVFNEEAACPRKLVEDVCALHGVSPVGWVTPPPKKRPVAFAPTPELVHGVTVSSPHLAAILRKAGWFSGKAASPASANVLRDADGFATHVEEDLDEVGHPGVV